MFVQQQLLFSAENYS